MILNVRTQSLNIRSGASTTDLKCIDSQEFPIMPVVDLSKGLQINVVDLKDMIQQVVFAASDDQARPVLTGVYVKVKDKKVVMAAADGFRLAVRKANLSAPAEHDITAIIPARAMAEPGPDRYRWRPDGDDGHAAWPGTGNLSPARCRTGIPAN